MLRGRGIVLNDKDSGKGRHLDHSLGESMQHRHMCIFIEPFFSRHSPLADLHTIPPPHLPPHLPTSEILNLIHTAAAKLLYPNKAKTEITW